MQFIHMKKSIYLLFILFMSSFILCIVYLTYIQVFQGSWLSTHPANVNTHLQYELTLLDGAENILIKKDPGENYKYVIDVPKTMGHILGYESAKYGRSGILHSINEHLSSLTETGLLSTIRHSLDVSKWNSWEVKLTIDKDIQEYVEKQMEGHSGAVVIMNPRTGAIIASASSPGYSMEDIDSSMDTLKKDDSAPLFNRATHGLYAPGSVFKLIIAGVALEKGIITPEEYFYCDQGTYEVGCLLPEGHGYITMKEAMALSCNNYFTHLAEKLGIANIYDYSKLFGFEAEFQLETGHAHSSLGREANQGEITQVSIGQGQVLITPIHGALIASSIANNGVMMDPYIIEYIRPNNGSPSYEREHKAIGRAIYPFTALTLKDMMVNVVESGTGRKAAVETIDVAGKTGTAEVSQKQPHSWFVGFAPAYDPAIALSVIIEEGGMGGDVAAPLAGELIKYILFSRSDIYGKL